MDICLGEIARCQRLSPKPNFIILLGDKYGWQPIPARIPSAEMELIRGELTDNEKALIDNWYRDDTNALPPEYVLQPRGDKYHLYEDWQKVERSLRSIIRVAASRLHFSEEERIKYFASATHQEIMRGALDPPPGTVDPKEHVFAHLRTIRGLPEDSTAGDYIDLSAEKRDAYSKAQLEKLKRDLTAKLPAERIYSYDATWVKSCTLDDAAAFGKKVYENLKFVIERQLQDIGDVDPLTREKSLHEDFRKERREHFTGRQDALLAIADYLNSPSRKVFSIIGASGTGKTSLLAKALDEAHDREGATIFRFLGTTSATSDASRFLLDLIDEVASAYTIEKNTLLHEGEDETKFSTLRGLQEIFSRCLNVATSEKPLLIVLDALDQLSRDLPTVPLDWVPNELPEQVKFIISALPELTGKLNHTERYNLGPMPTKEGEELLNTWLVAIKRTLTSNQIGAVMDSFTPNGTPLYLRLAFEKARRWHSCDTEISLKPDIDGVLDEYFDGLERNHELLLPKVSGYLLSGKYQGLTENELLDLLVFDEEYWRYFLENCHPDHLQEVEELKRLPIVIWSRLFLDLEPYLTIRNADGFSIVSFYHRKFIDHARAKYLSDPLPHHHTLAGYFEKAPLYLDEKEERPNVRKVVEQPYQETFAEQWGDVTDKSLASFPFLMAKTKSNMVEGVLEDYALLWNKAPEASKKQLDLWRDFFTEHAHMLRRGNAEWPAYKIFLQLAVEHANDSPLTLGAERWLDDGKCDWIWLRRIQRVASAGKGPCLAVFEGHTNSINGALETTDGRFLSWSVDKTLRLWEKNGRPLAVLEGHTWFIRGALETRDGRFLSWADDHTLRLWDNKGTSLTVLEGHTGPVSGALETRDGRFLSWADDHTLRLWDNKGTSLTVLEGHTGPVSGALETRDGRFLSWAGGPLSGDPTLRLWDNKGTSLAVLDGHTGAVFGSLKPRTVDSCPGHGTRHSGSGTIRAHSLPSSPSSRGTRAQFLALSKPEMADSFLGPWTESLDSGTERASRYRFLRDMRAGLPAPSKRGAGNFFPGPGEPGAGTTRCDSGTKKGNPLPSLRDT